MSAPRTAVVRRAATAIFFVLFGVFLYFYLRDIDFGELARIRVDKTFLAIAAICALGSRFWGAVIWLFLLKSLGAKGLKGQTAQLVYVYAKSWLGRYIPGTAPWILGKIYFASQHGVPRTTLAVGALLEGALQIVVTLAVAVAMLAAGGGRLLPSPDFAWLAIAATAAMTVALLPQVFNRLISLVHRMVRKRPLGLEHHARGATIAKGALLYVVSAVLGGLTLYFIARSVAPSLDPGVAPYILGAANLSGAVSMLAICTPSGWGVREAILLSLLAAVMSPEAALAVTVLSRVWGIAMDLAFFGLARLLLAAAPARNEGEGSRDGAA